MFPFEIIRAYDASELEHSYARFWETASQMLDLTRFGLSI